MPHATANQALAGGEEEDGGKENVCARGLGEIDTGGVEVKGNCQDNHKADSVGPDIHQFVGDIEGGAHAFEFRAGKSVAADDVRIYAPRVGKVFVFDQTMLLRSFDGVFDAFFEVFFGPSGFL